MENILKYLINKFHWREFTKVFSDQESRFRFSVSLKLTLIPLISSLIMGFFLMTILKINLIFFEANGFLGVDALREAYYDFVLSSSKETMLIFFLIFIFIFFMGIYISELMLRPFRLIGDYSEKMANGALESVESPDTGQRTAGLDRCR